MKQMKELLLYGIVLVFVFVLLGLLKHLSNSRFTFQTIPAPYDPYERFTDAYLGQPDAGAYANLYAQAANQGTMTTLYGSTPSIRSTSTLSFDLGPYTRAVFYDQPNYQGNQGRYENATNVVVQTPRFNEPELQTGSVQSVKLEIIRPYAIIYNQQNLGGNSMIVRGNVPTMTGDWANNVASMSISPFTKVTVYSLPGFSPQGNKKVFENYTSAVSKVQFVGAEMVSSVNSLKVEALFNIDEQKNVSMDMGGF